MSQLSDVVAEAATHDANTILCEPDRPVVATGPAGLHSLSHTFTERQLFDALGEVLAPEQQADLAVGNPVSFSMDGGGRRWGFMAEPREHGLVLRGMSESKPGPVDASSLQLPALELDDDDDGSPPPPTESRWGLRHASEASGGVAASSLPDELEIDTEDDEVSFADLEPAMDETDFSDVTPDDDDGISLGDLGMDSSEQEEHAISLDDEEAPAQAAATPAQPAAIPLQPPMPPMRHGASPSAPTMATAAVGGAPPPAEPAGDRPPPRDSATANLGGHAHLVEPGRLAFVQGIGLAEQVASVLGAPCHVVDGEVLPDWGHLEHGSLVAVRCEDPSQHLAWLLRRLEEGARVIVETRALSPEGARRILLGVDASDRAEAWLDQHPMRWFARGPGGWTAL